jgi:hypothetical protein
MVRCTHPQRTRHKLSIRVCGPLKNEISAVAACSLLAYPRAGRIRSRKRSCSGGGNGNTCCGRLLPRSFAPWLRFTTAAALGCHDNNNDPCLVQQRRARIQRTARPTATTRALTAGRRHGRQPSSVNSLSALSPFVQNLRKRQFVTYKVCQVYCNVQDMCMPSISRAKGVGVCVRCRTTAETCVYTAHCAHTPHTFQRMQTHGKRVAFRAPGERAEL